ncbi:hypothetical protein [Rhodoferax sp. GW822-FHT02A01]|jgi:preprotein translocase subunit SecY|uniref:hypothetical protein n=1 Tax=Rhodoferax sp. GW822-FHT02A01 TaxID=3141537 RepID=UPI00315D29FE
MQSTPQALPVSEVYRMKKDDDDEPSVWVTVLKLVVGAIILIGGTGLALWYVDQVQENAKPGLGSGVGPPDWGIVGDNPLKNRR